MGLLLQAVDVTGPYCWRWLLEDEESGNPLADHCVRLDVAAHDLGRFSDLYAYVRAYSAPDRRVEDGWRFTQLAGEWAGRELLGESIGAAILAVSPVAVRVVVPAVLEQVLLWPLELAHADGRPLAEQGDVTLVYDTAPDVPARPKQEAGTLRMLAVFSQPSRTSVLALRRERYALTRLIRRIAARERARIELQVVQYGVTRARLKEIADDGAGWDVLHVSGHGSGGVLLLEHEDGSPDPVGVDDLVRLLRPVRRRLKLAVVSACESAADTTAQTLRLLGLAEQAEQVEATEAGGSEQDAAASAEVPGLAKALVRELNCAVVAMRYPVTDEFAIAYADALYEHLFSRRQPVTLAAARALAQAAGPEPTAARPPLSMATPGVFGARAAGLSLPVPQGRPAIDPTRQPMAHFPAEPSRFVGRATAMARASTALASRSGRTTVLLHGMAGAGKTVCALELAHRHVENFAALVWWRAPTRGDEWATALADFANRLDIQLADYGFSMAVHIGTVAGLEAFLPRLRATLEASGVLLVLDNLETLLTPGGAWRDERWAKLIPALTSHDGESRVILTSRIPPAALVTDPASTRVVTLPVHALALDESVALARELPHLRALLHTDAGPDRLDEDAATVHRGTEARRKLAAADRHRAVRVLRVVQGHPKLMELADAAAADRARLDAQLAMAEEATAGQGLEAFFRDGTTTLDQEEFLASLTAWTVTALDALSPDTRLMAEFIACLEDDDRRPDVINANWADLWRRLDRPGDPPEPGPLLARLASAAMIETDLVAAETGEPPTAGDLPAEQDSSGRLVLRMHPGVAGAVAGAAGPGMREAVDAELAVFWEAVSGWGRKGEGREDSAEVVGAGLAAAPYLLRRGDWRTASHLLEHAIIRDGSPGMAQVVLPSLRRIAAATGAPNDARLLATVLMQVDPAEAERQLRGAMDASASAGDYRTATVSAGYLFNLLLLAGRLGEALAVATQMPELTRRAGLGPWTQLANQGQRLQVLGLMGNHAQVLAEVDLLRAAMTARPSPHGPDEAAEPWNVRENILNIGYVSALAMKQWAQCLELNAEITASVRGRGAGVHEVARTRFNDSAPLIRLGRLGEAGRLLAECQRVFEDHADTDRLAKVLSTRARLENELGNPQAAADLERTALRLRYALARSEASSIAIGHYNLASDFAWLGGDWAVQRAHRLAAALIYQLTDMSHDLAVAVKALAAEMRADGGTDPSLPSTVSHVIDLAQQTEGIRLAALLAALRPDAAERDATLADILHRATELPPEDSGPGITAYVQRWEPAIAAIADACVTGQNPSRELTEFLDEQAKDPDWSALVAALRRILAGELEEATLLADLDEIDSAIVRETSSRIAKNRLG